jgi:gamma-glutamylcyclotransferase (GGCT)/AIG2-like uncharacterized protein YtfP
VTDHLFVYGTLRAGAHEMHGVLAEAADLLGHARARGLLIDLGWYPGLVPTLEDRWVVGEVWRLRQPSVLERLDAYEGDEYERRSSMVQLHDGTVVTAWTYVYRAPGPLGPVIDSGDWMLHRRSIDG